MQQMRQVTTAAGALLLTVTLAVAGCGTAAAPSTTSSTATTASGMATTTAKTTACQGLGKIDEALTSLSKAGSNTMIGEVKATQQKIDAQLSTIASRIPGENGPVLTRLESANSQLAAALQGLPDSATVAETSTKLQGFQAKVANAQDAQVQLSTKLKCSP
jgi:hypothetical protein